MFHYPTICSRNKNKYLYIKTRKEKKLSDTSNHAARCETLKMRLTGWTFKAFLFLLLIYVFVFIFKSAVSFFIFTFSLFWLIFTNPTNQLELSCKLSYILLIVYVVWRIAYGANIEFMYWYFPYIFIQSLLALFLVMQTNWVQYILHRCTVCLCCQERLITPQNLLCLWSKITRKASLSLAFRGF